MRFDCPGPDECCIACHSNLPAQEALVTGYYPALFNRISDGFVIVSRTGMVPCAFILLMNDHFSWSNINPENPN
jgi:hypothetical protein